jgi:hypothetical protein
MTLAYVAGIAVGLAADSYRRGPGEEGWALAVSLTVIFALPASLLGAWAGRALARDPAD